jgi:predicted ATP-grasp superfamily ATP-dependent carboligase
VTLRHRGRRDGAWVLVSEGGDGESRAAVAAVRALARNGYRPVVTESNGRSLAGSSRSCALRVRVPPIAGGGNAYADAIQAELASRSYVAVFVATDAALIALNTPVRHLLDKAMCGELARAAGLDTPPTQVFDSWAALAREAERLSYPVVVKPAIKLSAARLVAGAGALEAAVVAMAGNAGRVLVQPVIDEPFHGLSGLAYQGRLVATMHTRYLRLWPQPCGTVAAAETIPPDCELEARVAHLLGQYDGPFHVDFAGRYLLDVNPRIHATLPLAVRGGANLVAMYCDLLQGRSVPAVRVAPGLRFRWLEGDLRSLWWNARRGDALTETFAALAPRRGTVHSFASIGDPGPALVRARYMLRRVARRPTASSATTARDTVSSSGSEPSR